MFDIDNDRQRLDSASKQIQIFLIQNGSPDKVLKYQFKRPLHKDQVCRVCEKQWQIKCKNIRFFAIDGVQYQDDDLSLIKNKQRVYISRGEQFDQQSNFGEYKILRMLGEGGFGKVMLAQNIITKQLAAVKIIKVQKICGASDIDMIFRQIENLKALNHPHIVKIINCYMLKNMQVYVVMEYLQGGELLKLLKQRKTISQIEAKNYFKQIVSAVCYCHRENIIHRDLKVQNILFKSHQDQFIKIADFGISGVADQFNPDFDAGTLKYMAPEVLTAKEKSNSPSVDVWACGVILYYMVFGVLPFHGTTTSHIIHSICQGKFTFPKQPQVSQQCKVLITKILQVNPKKRLKMQEVRDDPWLAIQTKVKHEQPLQTKSDPIISSPLSENKEKLKVIKLKQIVGNFSKLSQQQSHKKKQQRKSFCIPKIDKKPPINLAPVMNIHKRLQKEKDKTVDQFQSHGQKMYFINKPAVFKGNNSIELGVRLSGGGSNNPNQLHVSNYCSQELPSLKDPLPAKLSRGGQRFLNSSGNRREEKSPQARDKKMKKKSSMIQGWK